MRINLLAAVLAAGISVVACKPGENATPPPPPGEVTIDLECLDNGGVSFNLSPWRVTMTEHVPIRWRLRNHHGVNQAEIKPRFTDDAAKWPFVAPFLTSKPNAPAEGRGLKPAPRPQQPGDIYKYTVSTICYRAGGVQDTVVIDPDMIIPPRYQ